MESITDVANPSHYRIGDIETIDYIIDVLGVKSAIDYCHGNVIKYTGTRLHARNITIAESKKAIWYLNKIIELTVKLKHKGQK